MDVGEDFAASKIRVTRPVGNKGLKNGEKGCGTSFLQQRTRDHLFLLNLHNGVSF